jgi:hypothetical protein
MHALTPDSHVCCVHIHIHIHIRTLQGDLALGYDLRAGNFNEAFAEGLRGALPDVVLVKKVTRKEGSKGSKKRFKLRQLASSSDGAGATAAAAAAASSKGRRKDHGASSGAGDDEQQYEQFMAELEEDIELQQQLGLAPVAATPTAAASSDDAVNAAAADLAAVTLHSSSPV